MNAKPAPSPLLEVKVTTRAAQKKVVRLAPNVYKVSVTVVPEQGRANADVLTLLAEYLGVPKSSLTIVRGHTQSRKFISLQE